MSSAARLQSLLVCRDDDQRVILCSYHLQISQSRIQNIEDTVRKLIANDNFVKNKSFMITDDPSETVIFYEKDDFLFFAFTGNLYPSHQAGPLMKDFKKEFKTRFSATAVRSLAENGLSSEGTPILKLVSTKYVDVSSSGIGKAQQKVEETRQAMEQNVEKIIRQQDKVDELDEKSAELMQSSADFQKKATNLKRNMCLRRYLVLLLSWLLLFV